MFSPEWLAGFFDGEGCVRLCRSGDKKYGYYQPQLVLSQKDEVLMRAIAAETEGRVYKSNYTNNGCWTVRWSCLRAERFARHILPYSIVKKTQLEVMLEACKKPMKERATEAQQLVDLKKHVN